MTQTNMISLKNMNMEIADTANHSQSKLNKYSGLP